MVAIKLKLFSSGASLPSSGNDGNPEDGPSSQAGPSGLNGQNEALALNDGAAAHATSAHGHGSSAHIATPTPASSKVTGKRKKEGGKTTARKSLGPGTPSQGQHASKKQKHVHVAPSTPAPMSSSHARPTAIPAHVYSSGTTPITSGSTSPSAMAPPPLPSPGQTSSPLPSESYGFGEASTATPATPAGSDINVKDEPFDSEDVDTMPRSPDPLSLPFTPAYDSQYPMRGRTGGKVTRHKKPFKVLADKVMEQLRKKDDYLLFSEPVDTDEYSDYLGVIGGEDKAMDLGTMQNKLDNGEYRTMDDIESDLRKLVTAAERYNPPGSKPHASAGRMLTHGLKNIEKFRPIVMTPSPSPTRQSQSATPWRGHSVASGREATHPLGAGEEAVSALPPKHYIPVEMLSYPPNSLHGRAVAWSLTGGKRVYAKREIRARERFGGKWRRWGVDGSREVDDMDDINDIFYASRMDAPRGSNAYTSTSKKLRDYALTDGAYWDWPGFGGALGQPPVPFTQFPLRPHMAEKVLKGTEFGIGQEIEEELRTARSRPWTESVPPPPPPPAPADDGALAENAPAPVRPTWGTETTDADIIDRLFDEAMLTTREPFPDREWHAHYVERAGLNSIDWLDEMRGGRTAQAYMQSRNAFVEGARKAALAGQGESESRLLSPEEHAGIEAMCQYAQNEYHDGVGRDDVSVIAEKTVAALAALGPALSQSSPAKGNDKTALPSKAETQIDDLDSLLAPAPLQQRVQDAHFRATLRYILSPSDRLDFMPLFRDPTEFFREGMQAKLGLGGGVEWVARGIRLLEAAQRQQRAVEADAKAQVDTGAAHAKGKTAEDVEMEGGDTRNSSALSPAPGASASPASKPLPAGTSTSPNFDPYARKIQVLAPYVDEDADDVSKAYEHADVHTPHPGTSGYVTEQYPLVDSGLRVQKQGRPDPAGVNVMSRLPRPVSQALLADRKAESASDHTSSAKLQYFPVDLAVVRLEILALAKHYALPGVKKFSPEDAARLLPAGIQKFLTGEIPVAVPAETTPAPSK